MAENNAFGDETGYENEKTQAPEADDIIELTDIIPSTPDDADTVEDPNFDFGEIDADDFNAAPDVTDVVDEKTSQDDAQLETPGDIPPDIVPDATPDNAGFDAGLELEDFDFDLSLDTDEPGEIESADIELTNINPDEITPADTMMPESDPDPVSDAGAQDQDIPPAEEQVTSGMIEAALERVIETKFAEKIESVLFEVTERVIKKEIQQIKASLQKDLDDIDKV